MLRYTQVIYFLVMAQQRKTANDELKFLIGNGPMNILFVGAVFEYYALKDGFDQPTDGTATVLELKQDIEQAQAEGALTDVPDDKVHEMKKHLERNVNLAVHSPLQHGLPN